MTRRPPASAVFAGAAIAGLAGGWMLARRRHHAHRHDLFSRRSMRRFAAIAWLESAADPGALPILRDYLAWEPLPALKLRAEFLVRSLESTA